MHRQHIGTKVGLRAEPCHLPILKGVVRRPRRFGDTRGQKSHQGVGAFLQMGCAGDDNRRPYLRFHRAFEESNNNVPRLQSVSSASFSSSRRSEAARNSFKSSSDQESDPSILRSGAKAPSRSISQDNSPAASGASLRNAVSRDASCEVIEISMIPDSVYGHLVALGNDGVA